jgi:hypothetical protein
MPTAAQMDQLESQVRREEEPEYARLSQMRAAGQLSPGEYEVQKQSLDLRVQNKVDNMVWSRHALAQSHLKSITKPVPEPSEAHTQTSHPKAFPNPGTLRLANEGT